MLCSCYLLSFPLAYFGPEVDFISYSVIFEDNIKYFISFVSICLIFSVMFCAELLLIIDVNSTVGEGGG